MDLTKLSDADLNALASGNLTNVSDAGLTNLVGSNVTPTVNSPAEGFNSTLNFAGLNTHIPIPQNVENFLSGAGKAFSDLGTGFGQVTGLGSSTAQNVAETKRLDEPLMDTKAGFGGNIAGNIAATLPAMAIPGVNTYKGAMLVNASLGALQPTQTGIERALNTGIGAASGLGGQALGNTLAKFAQPIKSTLSPEEARLAKILTDNGVPLSAGEQLGNKPLQIIDSVMGNLPLTSGKEAARVGAQKAAYNSAILSKAGIDSGLATPDVLSLGKSSIGSKLGDIAKNNVLDFNQGLTDQLANIVDDASQHLPPAKAAQIADQVDQILSQVGKNGSMSGSNYQGWREPLRALSKKGDEFSRYFGQIRGAMDSSFRDQLPGVAGQDFRDLSGKYANLKTIINSMGGNSPSTLSGNINPAQLGIALSQSIGKEGKALGRGGLNDLVRAGNMFVRSNIPDSGTAQRQLFQSLLTGGGGAGVGAIAAGATGHDPITGALYGLGAGGSALMMPKVVQTLLNNQPVQNYLTKQAVSPTAAAMAKLLQNSGRAIGIASVPAITQ